MTTVEEQHQNISFIFMIKQWLPKFLVDVGGCGRTLEVHGGKFGEGVLIQVSIIVAEMFVIHGDFIYVNFLDDHPFSIKILTEERQKFTESDTKSNKNSAKLLNLQSGTLLPSRYRGKEIKEAVNYLLICDGISLSFGISLFRLPQDLL